MKDMGGGEDKGKEGGREQGMKREKSEGKAWWESDRGWS